MFDGDRFGQLRSPIASINPRSVQHIDIFRYLSRPESGESMSGNTTRDFRFTSAAVSSAIGIFTFAQDVRVYAARYCAAI